MKSTMLTSSGMCFMDCCGVVSSTATAEEGLHICRLKRNQVLLTMFKPMLTATTGWTGYESCIGKRQTKVIKIDKMGRLKRKQVFLPMFYSL